MITEVVNLGNAEKYDGLFTEDELFGIVDERFSCFGAWDEENDEPMGVLTAQVLPKHIMIRKIFTVPEKRRRGAATALLNVVTDLPDELKMPIYLCARAGEVEEDFMLEKGFKREKSKYLVIEGNIDQMSKICDLKNNSEAAMKNQLEIVEADYVDPKLMGDFVKKNGVDDFLQLPEGYVDMDRFSGGSFVCKKKNEIDAVALVEEVGGVTEITYVHGNDPKSVPYIISTLRWALNSEYGRSSKVRFLICNLVDKEEVLKLFADCEEIKIRKYRLS